MRTTMIALVMWSTASLLGCTEEAVSLSTNTNELTAAGQAYSQFLLHTGTVFGLVEDARGDFTMADVDRDGRQDLVFVKRRSTGTGRVEVHVASAASGFRTIIQHATSPFIADEDSFGDFAMADTDLDGRPDLVFIKRRATGSGRIEVHVASAASGFQTVIQHAATALATGADNTGDFRMSDIDRDGRADLVFIKRRSTGTGSIEVHVMSAASGYQTFIQHAGSGLSEVEDGLGEFAMADADRDGRPDLVYFKDQTTPGTVEVHIVSAASGYQTFLQHATTALPSDEGAFGDFVLSDHNADGRLDLVFLKLRKTGTGTIELHVLGG
jgi:5-hydroxyisourate hydrolase-like protein (transthyretin family)